MFLCSLIARLPSLQYTKVGDHRTTPHAPVWSEIFANCSTSFACRHEHTWIWVQSHGRHLNLTPATGYGADHLRTLNARADEVTLSCRLQGSLWQNWHELADAFVQWEYQTSHVAAKAAERLHLHPKQQGNTGRTFYLWLPPLILHASPCWISCAMTPSSHATWEVGLADFSHLHPTRH